MTLDLERVLETAVAVAREAGQVLARGQRAGFSVEQKAGSEIVTECDRRSEVLIVERLRAAFPAFGLVAEEGSGDDHATAGRPTWYVDPLDGTNNFAHGLPWYTVSLGLELDGQALVAVVHAPSTGWTWTATRGGGCRLNGEAARVSQTDALDKALVATGFAYDRWTSTRNNISEFNTLLMRCSDLRRVGAASLDCAMVASGWLDGYWELTLRPWDVSAGALLVEEAGGHVSAVDGSPFSSAGGAIVASNGRLHPALLSALSDAVASSPAGSVRSG